MCTSPCGDQRQARARGNPFQLLQFLEIVRAMVQFHRDPAALGNFSFSQK
jgi:hypothetical protein